MTYRHKEANWGPVISVEVEHGSHFTFELPLVHKKRLIALRLSEGIHGGDKTKLFFPHGLIRFGEAVDDCIRRVVHEIARVRAVEAIAPFALETWLDDQNHYHICATMIVTIGALPKTGDGIEEVVVFDPRQSITQQFAWWSAEDIDRLQSRVAGK